MRFKSIFILILTLTVYGANLNSAYAQTNGFNSGRQKVGGGKDDAFNSGRSSNFNDYRSKLNAEYVRLTKEQWRNFDKSQVFKNPMDERPDVKPVVINDNVAPVKSDPIVIDEVVNPVIKDDGKKAQPVAPIKDDNGGGSVSKFDFFGSNVEVRDPSKNWPRLSSTNENAVASFWEVLGTPSYNAPLVDLLKIKKTMGLCDWAYLQLLDKYAQKVYGGKNDESLLLMAFLYSNSGYQIRLGRAGNSLEMLFATKHKIYNRSYFPIDGVNFFAYRFPNANSLNISSAYFPKEQPLSLNVGADQQFKEAPTSQRRLTSKQYPEMNFVTTTNKNALDFYNTYPPSEVGGNLMTRWAMLANSSLSPQTKETLYPQLRSSIASLSQKEAVERILNWMQTAFVYEYDDKVWGGDRAFFPEETLFYPYCDCEDRAILFTRLVRDLVGLDCILVFYPGHLAAAVSFNETVPGDYITINGQRFVICDPTYIGAGIGLTMPGMDNMTAKAIVLRKS